MLKPNTLCMIRGVPHGQLGADCNGKIVVAKRIAFEDVWDIAPHVITAVEGGFRALIASRAKYLHPLDNPSDDVVDTHSTRKETV